MGSEAADTTADALELFRVPPNDPNYLHYKMLEIAFLQAKERAIQHDARRVPTAVNFELDSPRGPDEAEALNRRVDELKTRLEAATSRLEDVAQQTTPRDLSSSLMQAQTPATNGGASPIPVGEPLSLKEEPESLPPSIQAFDALMEDEVGAYMKLSARLGGPVEQQAANVNKAFFAERQVLLISTKAKKPDAAQPIYIRILKELQHQMGAVNDIREANRSSHQWHHLNAVAEGISSLAWITIEPKPADYVDNTVPSSKYWGDRVMKEFKETDKKQDEWIKAFYKIFKSLGEYIRKYHSGGVTWNSKGMDAEAALLEVENGPKAMSSATPKSKPSSSGPAPPPPPPPLPTFDLATGPPRSSKSTTDGGMDAVFSQLNQGSSVTSGLRKVDRSEMTHKNPSLRASGTVPSRSDSNSSRGKSPAPPGTKPKPESMRIPKKPARCELEGNKWLVENYDSPAEPVTIKASINHHVMISRCTKTAVIIDGKANAISVENSPDLKLLIGSLVSSVDVIKSSKFALQVDGVLPTILLDQIDGGSIYLSKTSLETEIFSSKCTSLNVVLPPQTEEDDSIEHAVPEQIRSFIRDGKLVSEIVEHAG